MGTSTLTSSLTPELVYAELLKLGDTGDQVAASIDAARVRGVPCCPSRCLLAEYLHWQWPHLERVEVHVEHANFWAGDRRFSVALPAACVQLVGWFDNGRWPALEIGGKQ